MPLTPVANGKNLQSENFNYFVWTPLGSRVNININFCLQILFKESAAWYFFHILPLVSMTTVANLPPVSLIPVAICQRFRWHRRQICRRYDWHRWQICHRYQKHWQNWGQNLPPVISVTICHRCHWYRRQFCRRCRWHRWQIWHRCCWYRWCTLTSKYLREFSKKFETVLMGYSGAGGKLTHEKNQKQKILWHCPFKRLQIWAQNA